MKERSFTRCTVLVPTPRALAVANMPLPIIIDYGFIFRVGSIFGRLSCSPASTAHPQDLHRQSELVAWTPCRFA
jgi:hypothetical protein